MPSHANGAAAAVGAALLLLTSSTAVAAPTQIMTSEQAEEYSVRLHARSSGQSVADVSEYVRGQGEFAQAVAEIRSLAPTTFVTSVWDGPSSAKTAIYVKPGARSAIARQFPRYKVSGVNRMSEAEATEVTAQVAAAITQLPEILTAEVGVDPLTDSVQVEYTSTRRAARSTGSETLPDAVGKAARRGATRPRGRRR